MHDHQQASPEMPPPLAMLAAASDPGQPPSTPAVHERQRCLDRDDEEPERWDGMG
jgi:hypothetical protein